MSADADMTINESPIARAKAILFDRDFHSKF